MNNNVSISSNPNGTANEIKVTKFEPTLEHFQRLIDKVNEEEHIKTLEYALSVIAILGPEAKEKKTAAIKSFNANKQLYNGAKNINHKMQCMIHMLVDLAEYQNDWIVKILENKSK